MLLRKKIKNSFTKLRQVYTVFIATELLAGNSRCNNDNYKIVPYKPTHGKSEKPKKLKDGVRKTIHAY